MSLLHYVISLSSRIKYGHSSEKEMCNRETTWSSLRKNVPRHLIAERIAERIGNTDHHLKDEARILDEHHPGEADDFGGSEQAGNELRRFLVKNCEISRPSAV